MKKKSLDILKFALGWPLSFLAILFIYNTFSGELSKVTTDFSSLNITYLSTGFICFLIYYFLRSSIWYTMLKYSGYKIEFAECTYLWGVAQLKRYIPGNFWSFIGLGVIFSDKNVSKKHITNSIVVEQQLVVLTASFLSLLALPFIIQYFLPFLNDIPYIQNILLLLFSLGTLLYIYFTKIASKLHRKIGNYTEHIFPSFAPMQNFTLIILMTTSFVFLALGYFFLISSLVDLPLGEFSSLIGLFIFALLVGFLSFIFPTGLGIREGVLTLGLSKFIPLGIAGFATLFSRSILIASELVAIGIAYVLMKNRQNIIGKSQIWIANNLQLCIVLTGIWIFSIYFSLVSILRYDNFYTGRFDLGNMSQTIWNTTQGRIFELTNPNGTEIVSRLAFHADYFLILLTPFYMLWQDPRIILIIQAVIVAVGAIFIYLLSKYILKDKTISAVLALLYLLNPALQRATIYDFHSVVPATTFILAAFYFMLQKKYRWFLLFSLLAAITKEQIWFLLGLFGLYIAIIQKKYLFGALIASISFMSFYLHLWHIIPNAAGDTHFAVSYYSEDSTSPTDIIKNIFFSPIESFQIITNKEGLRYYLQLLGPLGFLSLAAPLYLVFAGPDLAINIFSQKPELHTIYYQYTAVITPFLFIATIYGIKNIRKLFPFISLSLLGVYLALSGLYFAYIYGPLPGAKDANIAVFTRPQKNKEIIMEKIGKIPQHAEVAATNNLGPQLSHRRYLYTVPLGINKADFTLYLMRENSPKVEKESLEKIKKDKDFKLQFKNASFYIFKRNN